MIERHSTTRPHRPGRVIIMALGILIGGALLLHWSWNALATGPFTILEIQFKHALALELFLLAVYLILKAASQLFSSSHEP